MTTEHAHATGPVPAIDGFSGLEEIGRGGFATVYRAVQADLGRPVAVKVLDVAPGTDREAVLAAFDAERTTLGLLGDVAGIVGVHLTTSTSDGRPAIVMELMEMSLLHRIRRAGPLDAAEMAAVGVRLARALAEAHGHGVFHRDIKPANVLVGRDGLVALADFGLAALDRAGLRPLQPGSPEHAAPERARGDEAVDLTRADVWSLGSTLFHVVAGHPPFGTRRDLGGLEALVERICSDPLPDLDRPGLAPHLSAVLAQSLAKDPTARFPSAAAMADALEEAAAAPTYGAHGRRAHTREGHGSEGSAGGPSPGTGAGQISLPTAVPLDTATRAREPGDDLPTLPVARRRPSVEGVVVEALRAEERRAERRRARLRTAAGAAAVVLAGAAVGGALVWAPGGTDRPAPAVAPASAGAD